MFTESRDSCGVFSNGVHVFGYKLKSKFDGSEERDLLLELFSKVGGRCFYCFKQTDERDMVLCVCGDLVCLRCFLKDLPCSDRVELGKKC